jgi:hypothetical protein
MRKTRYFSGRANRTTQTFQRLRAKLERGAAEAERGDLFDGDAVFEGLRELIAHHKRARSARKKKAVRL